MAVDTATVISALAADDQFSPQLPVDGFKRSSEAPRLCLSLRSLPSPHSCSLSSALVTSHKVPTQKLLISLLPFPFPVKAVSTQAVAGALGDIEQHTRSTGGGAQQGGRAVAEVKDTASKEHPASAFPSSLSFTVHLCVRKHLCTWRILFFFPCSC